MPPSTEKDCSMTLIPKVAAILLAACVAVPAFAQETPKHRPEIMTRDGKGFTFQERLKEGEKEPNKNPIVVFDVVSVWQNAQRVREPRVANCDKFQTTLKGVTWCFVNKANMDKFTAATDKDGKNSFVPFVGGRCTLAVANGMLDIYGDPRTARIVRGDFGPILVLHGSKKWWPLFNEKKSLWLAVATSNWNMSRSPGPIIPNDKLTESSAQRR